MKDVTKTWSDEEYKNYRGKWSGKKEYKAVKQVRDRFSNMASGRRTSCPWASPFSEETEIFDDDLSNVSRGTGSDWADRWNRDDQIELMYHEYERDRTDLKSPMTFAPVQAALAEFMENDVGVLFIATEQEDEDKVKINRYIHEYWENKADIKRHKGSTFYESLVRGTSIPHTGWAVKKRMVDIIKTGKETEKEIDKAMEEREEEIEAIKDTIIKEQRPLTDREEIVEYNDVVYVPTSLFEIYVDPDARCLRGPSYEASDLVWRQIPSVEQFRAEFKNSTDPYVIKANVNKVKSTIDAEGDYQGSSPFFKSPRGIAGAKIELLRYYNKPTDKYLVVANDVIIRDGPLPYNHKEIPFARHRFYELKHQFYGAGLAVILESPQAEDETLRNMLLDQLKLNINPPLFITSDVYADVDYGYEDVLAGAKIEVGGSVGEDSIRWLQSSGPNYEAYKMRETLREDAVIASGINPMAYSTPREDEAVRNNIMAMESTLKMVKKGIKYWGYGWTDAVRQMIRIRQQMLPDSYIEEVDKEGKITTKRPTVRTDKIEIEYDGVTLDEKRIDGYGYFQVKDEYLDLVGDIDIQLDADTFVPRSHGLRIQQVNDAMDRLVPILANPQILEAPGVNHLVREYVKRNGLDYKIMEQLDDESSEDDIESANAQEKSILGGQPVPGLPGESPAHINSHYRFQMELVVEREKVQKVIDEAASGPMGMQMGPPQDSMERLMKVEGAIADMADHIMADATSRSAEPMLAVQAGAGQIPQGGMGQPQSPIDVGGMPQQQALPGEGLPAGQIGV